MRYCEHCGSQRSDTAKFCPKCGRPVEGNTCESNQTNTIEANQVDPISSGTRTKMQALQILPSEEKATQGKTFNNKPLLLALSLCTVLILITGIYFSQFREQNNDQNFVVPQTSPPPMVEVPAPPKQVKVYKEDPKTTQSPVSFRPAPSLNAGNLSKVGPAWKGSEKEWKSFRLVTRNTSSPQNEWLTIDFEGNGQSYQVTIDPRPFSKPDNSLPILKVLYSNSQLIFKKELAHSNEWAVPYVINRQRAKEQDLVIISGGGSGNYFDLIEIIGSKSGQIQSLLSSFPQESDWEDNISSVRNGQLVKSEDERIFVRYSRKIKNWNGPGEANRPSKAYIRELIWNSSKSIYELGQEKTP